MAHIWLLDGDPREWTPMPLVGDALTLVNGTLRPVDETPPIPFAQTRLVIRRLAEATHTWALLTTSRALRLNGDPVPLGVALLDDRDEIRLPDLTVWFSTEAQAHVEPFPESTRGFCPRCKQPIEVATPAVRCPGCALWHHASDELPCWSYASTCAACSKDTALDAGYRWTPEDL
ncbi:MAG: hypothetical protein HOP16_16325 [Acidobacteria bacterium]|nr:hypothetical protein [Acidobacteriota bacterium]